MKYLFLIFFINFLPQYAGKSLSRDGNYPKTFEDIKKEIAGYSSIAKAIIDLAVHGKAQNRSYERLAVFADTIGPRLSGSKNLDAAIKYMFSALQEDRLENVHLEPVKVPHWERGEEFAVMLEPRNHSIAILGLGSSIATPPEGFVSAEPQQISFLTLLISICALTEDSTGCISCLLASGDRVKMGGDDYPGPLGTKVVVYLKMGAKTYPDSSSFNTVAEIVGSKYPEQIVLVSGHLDSWDVGQGAMDDGGGAFISWEALSLVKDLGLRPKRTLRLVLWTGEEQGGIGAEQYYQLHKKNISNFDVVMESDEGTFRPMGLAFTGTDEARDIVKEIMTLLLPINITDIYDTADGTDIDYWMRDGVPGASLRDDISKYFWFHHSHGDTMTVQDPNQMNLCAAVWTVVSYVIADMKEMLPR
ncbi:carboxypeptidase Q isoform X3 [Apteryx rowi]|uniref:carboxypeptidase Q isoform X3 n=1 Tax=Apteryx rowi TaxID=308060 RepID=UPI000E1D930A|nr:carboxypeptidase Q isoform X3 [Apteryx rowi]